MTRAGRFVMTAAALALLAAPAAAFEWPWGRGTAQPTPEPRPIVTEVLAERQQLGRSVPGVIVAQNQVTLAFQTLGRLISRDVELGDVVTKGQSLARLNPDDLTGNVRAAEAGLAAAQVQLATAQSTAERTRELARRQVAPTAQLEQAEQALAAAQAAAERAESELVRARDAESFAEITAPFDGVVSAVYENAGAVVAAGAPVIQLSAREGREAVIDLPESSVANLPPDVIYTVWEETAPERATSARVERIDPMADTATRMRRVHLSLENGGLFRLGALIRARLDVAGSGNMLSVPEVALFDHDGAPHVWLVRRADPNGSSGTVHRTPVTTGISLDNRILIGSGLSPSAEVVVRGVHSLTEGQQVGQRIEP